MKRFLAAVFSLLVTGGLAEAASLDIDANDYSVQGRIIAPILEDAYGRSEFNGRFLLNEDEDLILGSFGLDFFGQVAPGLDLGVGLETLGGEKESRLEDQELLAVALGARLSYYPPGFYDRLRFMAKAFYAPKVLSFLDLDRALETGLRVSYAITTRVDLYAEYQRIGADFDDLGDQTIDEGIRLGFMATF